MFRNQYDTDVTVWSPEGRLLQVEYAMESVKQGSACVGLRSNKYVVLGAIKRSISELSSHQKKLIKIDDHISMGIAGLTADARSLGKYMINECLNHKYVYGSPLPPHLLVQDLADKHQRCTQTYVRRPYGVGLLLACVDTRNNKNEPHLYQTCPSGNLYEFYASAIGARSQSARTYLEKHYESFGCTSSTSTSTSDDNDNADPATSSKTTEEPTKDELIVHALQALVGCVSGDDELTKDNGSVTVVGPSDENPEEITYTLLEGDELQPFLDRLEIKQQTEDDDDDNDDNDEGGSGSGEGEEAKEEGGGGDDEPQAMET